MPSANTRRPIVWLAVLGWEILQGRWGLKPRHLLRVGPTLVRLFLQPRSPVPPSSAGTCGDIATNVSGSSATSSPEVIPSDSSPSVSYIWSITPGLYGTNGLPPGLNFDSASAAIYGVPTKEGDYFVTVHVTDSNNYRINGPSINHDFPEPDQNLRYKLGEYWMLPRRVTKVFRTSQEINGVLTEPIPDNPVQSLVPYADLRRTFWGPVPLWSTVGNGGEISSVMFSQRATVCCGYPDGALSGSWTVDWRSGLVSRPLRVPITPKISK